MSDAYACDRCGKCRPGAPHKTIGVGDGVKYQRTAPAIDQEMFHDHGPGGPYTDAVDLCPACWNDLKRFWTDGGGSLASIGVSGDTDE
jgi:hypothetical protein